jgi:hypothetical protein
MDTTKKDLLKPLDPECPTVLDFVCSLDSKITERMTAEEFRQVLTDYRALHLTVCSRCREHEAAE